MEAIAQITRKLDWFGIAENLDGLFCLIHHQLAFVAFDEVALDLEFCGGIEVAINEVRKLADDFFAVQFAPPCLK